MRKLILLSALAYTCILGSPRETNAVEGNEPPKIGGIAGLIYQDQNRDKAGKWVRDYYDFHPVYIYVNPTLNEFVSGFIELEYEHIPQFKGGSTVSGSGEIKMERGYIQANVSSYLNFQLGKFFTNFGPWYESHWRWISPTYERNMALENAYVPTQQVGSKLYSDKLFLSDELSVKYALWHSMGSEISGTDSPKDSKFAWGTQVTGYFRGITFGSAYYTQNNPAKKDRRENNLNLFGSAKIVKQITLTSEWTKHYFNGGYDGTKYKDAATFYAGIEYDFADKWSAYYRFEAGKDEKRTGFTGSKANTNIIAYALTWSPAPGYRMKAEYSRFNFRDSSLKGYRKIIISNGIVF